MTQQPRQDLVSTRLSEHKEKKAHNKQFILFPESWKGYSKGSHTWTTCSLDRISKPNIPNKPGIYTIIIRPNIAGHQFCSYLMYVGKAISLQRRFGQYIGHEKSYKGREEIFNMLHMYDGFLIFSYTVIENASENQLYELELALYNAYNPPCNSITPAKPAKTKSAKPAF